MNQLVHKHTYHKIVYLILNIILIFSIKVLFDDKKSMNDLETRSLIKTIRTYILLYF